LQKWSGRAANRRPLCPCRFQRNQCVGLVTTEVGQTPAHIIALFSFQRAVSSRLLAPKCLFSTPLSYILNSCFQIVWVRFLSGFQRSLRQGCRVVYELSTRPSKSGSATALECFSAFL